MFMSLLISAGEKSKLFMTNKVKTLEMFLSFKNNQPLVK
jgi:hypothetical protein